MLRSVVERDVYKRQMAGGFLNIPVPIIPKFRVGHYALHNTVSMRVLS